ncbi:site-specific integrase [Periweissella cryptocerci]|uniref:Site-specific integrase n=1 Tax=Periweissella cryptocerci TaxID=2506420 RepID=A0A4P6YWP8_9LACO|nr:site-specific integrase [Periweissella cryptocerci]QBO37197.1 site-specific integrase [Periweissella cryptocerci]
MNITHMMRHAFVTFAISARMNERDVMNYVGHATITMTQEYNLGTIEGLDKVANTLHNANL